MGYPGDGITLLHDELASGFTDSREFVRFSMVFPIAYQLGATASRSLVNAIIVIQTGADPAAAFTKFLG